VKVKGFNRQDQLIGRFGIHAVTQARRTRAIFEDVAKKVAVAPGAKNFRADHAVNNTKVQDLTPFQDMKLNSLSSFTPR
jgi:hypothetical protein